MDATSLSHVAAVVVGVLVTLFLVGGFGNKKEETTTKSVSAPATTNGASTTASKNSKKKKKKKSKGGNSGESTPAATESKKEEPKIESRSIPALETESADAPAPAPQAAKKKKKKKKKNTSSSTSAPAPAAETTTSAPATEPEVVIPPEPVPQVEEEAWITQPSKKKKNRNKKKASAAAAVSTPVVAEATAAAPAGPTVAAVTDSISIDAKKVGIVIGPKGATMKAIEEKTGCKLDINAPSKDDPKPRSSMPQKAGVVISGDTREAVTMARRAVAELEKKGYAKILQDENFGEYNIPVHPRFLSEIVGPGGRTIQALQSSLEVKITIPPTDWKPNAPQVGQVKLCRVGIAGDRDNAKKAKEVIKELTEYHHHEITHPGVIHEEVNVPQEFFHCVIGPRGSEIKHIRGNFKVDVYMPNAESVTDNVLVVGKQTAVDRAISYIHTLIERDTEQKQKKYSDEFY